MDESGRRSSFQRNHSVVSSAPSRKFVNVAKAAASPSAHAAPGLFATTVNRESPTDVAERRSKNWEALVGDWLDEAQDVIESGTPLYPPDDVGGGFEC
jgi:hypothetical protein